MPRRVVRSANRPALLALSAALISASGAFAQSAPEATGASGLPVPRYVSLKSDRVNMRVGPGVDYRTAWVYRQAGLPLEVIKEYEGWRQVRDAYGASGWVLQSLLSGRRTALVLPWEVKTGQPPPKVALRDNDSERARPVAMVEAGVIANISSCDGLWCYVNVDRFHGYIEQKKLWGVYESEVIK
jgi:SH3-like domain-containing protein